MIVTDWYHQPQSPAERVKVTTAILDQEFAPTPCESQPRAR